jgi:hypothetical protein
MNSNFIIIIIIIPIYSIGMSTLRGGVGEIFWLRFAVFFFLVVVWVRKIDTCFWIWLNNHFCDFYSPSKRQG